MTTVDGGQADRGIDALSLPMPPQPHPYLAQMARFCDGDLHAQRRADLLAVLPPAEGLQEAAFARASAQLTDRLDVVPLAYRVPVATLGEALGVGDLSAEIAALCEQGTVSATLPDLARTSLLFQCRDATAAVIMMALADGVTVEQAAPVLRTRRAGGMWVSLAGAAYGAGRHACPGRQQALALARGTVTALAGYIVAERGADQPRPNIKMPSRLVMARR